MKILITGGSGFIGTRLIDELSTEDHEIVIYDKVKSKKYPNLSISGDVRNKEELIEACEGVDIIYNLAAEHADNVTPISLYKDVNVGGAVNVVEAAKLHSIKKIVFTSSVAIYGLNRGTPTEAMEAQPFNEYGYSKYEAEKVLLSWQKEDKENALSIVRPAVIFGEGNRGNVYNLLNQIVSGKFAIIGNGLNKKSMGYVGNIAQFLSTLKESQQKLDIINFAGKNDMSIHEIVSIVKDEMSIKKNFISIPYFIGLGGGILLDIISRGTGKKFPISLVRVQKFVAETTVSTEHLYNDCQFKERYTLEEGLRKTICYEFKNSDS